MLIFFYNGPPKTQASTVASCYLKHVQVARKPSPPNFSRQGLLFLEWKNQGVRYKNNFENWLKVNGSDLTVSEFGFQVLDNSNSSVNRNKSS